MKRVVVACLMLCVGLVASAQRDAPYVQYYSRAIGAFVIERADGSDSRLFAPDVMPDEHQAVEIVGWSPSGEYFAWLSAPVYLTGGIITYYGVWLVDAEGNALDVLDSIDDLTSAYWSSEHDTLYLLSETYGDEPPTVYTFDAATQTMTTTTGDPAELPPARPTYPEFGEPFVSPDGRVQVDSDTGMLTDTASGATVPVQRFSGYVGETVCDVHWNPGGAWFIREDGVIIAGGGCPSGYVVADVAGTTQRELTGCPLGGDCAIWIPDHVAASLAPGAESSVVPAPAALLRHIGMTIAVGWRPDGQALAAFEDTHTPGAWTRNLLVWTNDGGAWTRSQTTPVEADCYAWVYPGCEIEWNGDGRQLAISTPFGAHIVSPDMADVSNETFAGWAATGEPVFTASLYDADYDPATNHVARIAASDGGQWGDIVEIIDVATGDTVARRLVVDEGDFSSLMSVSFLPDGSGVALVTDEPKLWRIADDSLVSLPVAAGEYVTGVEAAGDYIFAYGLTALVHVYDAETGELLTRLNRHAYDVALSPDGSTLATAGGDGVSLWDLATVVP